MTHVDGGGVPSGTRLNGIYEIDKRIAMGGMGEVYLAHDQFGKKFAIKMILQEHANNQIIIDLFNREADTLHDLNHPAIVRYYVFTTDPELGRPYLAMEFAGGPALNERLREGGPLKQEEMDVLRPRIAGGLHAAHQLGIIHRDISPDNVILVDGEVAKAKIIDFGIAKSTTSKGTLIGSGFAGKLNYVSPEQLGLEGAEVTGKSDIYSLGLVFAEAVTGAPLPMGGSHAEVIDKRRVVPDLSGVPAYIRPLIEAMVQPDPANRPADMDEVANWSPGGGAAAAAPAAPVHPRERRKATSEEPGKKGLPWLWIGLGGAGAAAAVAAFLLLGPGGDPTPGSAGTDQTQAALSSRAASAQAPTARVGDTYAWGSLPFIYDGAPSELSVTLDGRLPRGLNFEATPDGGARITGTPQETGDFSFAIVATTPDGATARQGVRLSVRPEEIVIAQPAVGGGAVQAPATPPPSVGLLAPPVQPPGEDTPVSSGVGGAGQVPVPPVRPTSPQQATGGTAIDDSSPGRPSAPAGGQPSVGSAPQLPATLTPPASQDGTAMSGGASDVRPGASQPGILQPPAPGSGGAPLPVSPNQGDQGDNLPEPNVLTGGPATLQPGSGQIAQGQLNTGGGASDPAIPLTGGAPLQPPGGGIQSPLAIPGAQNQPPTIQDSISAPVRAEQGRQVNLRLGSFFDEAGGDAVQLQVDGRMPNGMRIRKGEGGSVHLEGSPTDFGEFDVRITAVDPQGLASEQIAVRIEVAPQTQDKDLRDYILGYDGGPCFLSRPMQLGARSARIEVFADTIPPAVQFDEEFKRDHGFEASIGLRLVTQQQCFLFEALNQVGPQALDNSLRIDLVKDELASGDRVRGSIAGGAGTGLFLIDHLGGINDLKGSVRPSGEGVSFDFQLHGDGQQVLIAARPEPDYRGGLDLQSLLNAARAGQAALALAYIVVKM